MWLKTNKKKTLKKVKAYLHIVILLFIFLLIPLTRWFLSICAIIISFCVGNIQRYYLSPKILKDKKMKNVIYWALTVFYLLFGVTLIYFW